MFLSLYRETSLLFPFPLNIFQVTHNGAGKYLRINLCGLYGSMSEQFLHSGNSHPLMNQQGGTGMTAHMVGYPFLIPHNPASFRSCLFTSELQGKAAKLPISG